MKNQLHVYRQIKEPNRFIKRWRHFIKNRTAYVALIVFMSFIFTALFAPLIAPFDPATQFAQLSLPPSWYELGKTQYLFGTDDLGRDIFSRLVFGTRLSLSLAFTVVSIAALCGFFFGVITSVARSWLDTLILRLMDLLLALPSLLLAVVIVAIIGPGLPNAIYAVALVLIPRFGLATRTAIKEELKKQHVVASRLDGINGPRLFFHSILPNIIPPIIVQASLAFSTAILEIASLGFLGLGAQAPTPEWGTILSESHDYIITSPWSVALPGLAILITVLSTNLAADGLREAMKMESN